MPNPLSCKRFHVGPGVIAVSPRIPKVCRRFRLCDASFIPSPGGHTVWPGSSVYRQRPQPPGPRADHGLQVGLSPGATVVEGNVDAADAAAIAGERPPRTVSGPAGISSSSAGTRMSQLRGNDDNEMPWLALRRRGRPLAEGCDSRWPGSSSPTAGLHGDGSDPLDAARPDVSRTTTRTGPPWTRGSGSEFISQASTTSRDMALGNGIELPYDWTGTASCATSGR